MKDRIESGPSDCSGFGGCCASVLQDNGSVRKRSPWIRARRSIEPTVAPARESFSSRKNARTSGGRVDIKTTHSSVHSIKCRQAFAERGQRERSLLASANIRIIVIVLLDLLTPNTGTRKHQLEINNHTSSRVRYPTSKATMASILLASVLLLSFSCLSHTEGRPDFIHCQNNLECEAGYCCTIEPVRYSTPQCRPMQAAGEMCRPSGASTINMTAWYPDGTHVLLTDVHYVICPCADGLFCDKGTCSEKQDSNLLID